MEPVLPSPAKFQEYILFAPVSSRRHDQVLNILAGVTAMQPVPVCEQHLVYAQIKHIEKGAVKKTAAGKPVIHTSNRQLVYRQLIRDVPFECNAQDSAGTWRLRAEDLPEAGSKTFISRSVTETTPTDVELENFRGGSDENKYRNQFLLRGHRFTHKNTTIRLYRLCYPAEGHGALEALDAPLPLLDECRVLDPSGAYLMDACVRLVDPTNDKLAGAARDEILGLKGLMEGAVEWRVGERLALDTRVKG